MSLYVLTRTILIIACLFFICLGLLGEYKNRHK